MRQIVSWMLWWCEILDIWFENTVKGYCVVLDSNVLYNLKQITFEKPLLSCNSLYWNLLFKKNKEQVIVVK